MVSRVSFAVLALLIGAFASRADALQAPPPPPPALCATSDLVVVAEITGAESGWTERRLSPIETAWDLHVFRVAFGSLPATPLRVVTQGGDVSGVSLHVSEQPALRIDHRYLLLLTERSDGQFVATGGPAGVVPLPRPGDHGPTAEERAAVAALGGCDAD